MMSNERPKKPQKQQKHFMHASLPTLIYCPIPCDCPQIVYQRHIPRKLLKFLDKTGASLLDICHILKRKLNNCLPCIFHQY